MNILFNKKYRVYATNYIRSCIKKGTVIDYNLVGKIYHEWCNTESNTDKFKKLNAIYEYLIVYLNANPPNNLTNIAKT